jgi:hypothetical protein
MTSIAIRSDGFSIWGATAALMWGTRFCGTSGAASPGAGAGIACRSAAGRSSRCHSPSVAKSGVDEPSAIIGSRSGKSPAAAGAAAALPPACFPSSASAASPARIAGEGGATAGRSEATGGAPPEAATAAPLSFFAPSFASEAAGTTTSVGSAPASESIRENVGSRSLSSAGRNSLRARSAAFMSGSTPRSASVRLSEM